MIYRTSSSNFRQLRAIVARDTKRGFYIEENPPVLPLINTDMLAVACFDALDNGAIMKRENMVHIDGVFVGYSLIVTIGIVSSQLRLDHALALMNIAPASATRESNFCFIKQLINNELENKNCCNLGWFSPLKRAFFSFLVACPISTLSRRAL